MIPSNDDAIRAIKLLVGKMADAVIEGRTMVKDVDRDETLTVTTPAERAAAGARPHFEEEVELDDKDLLGASTLAKLGPSVEEIAAAEIVEEVVDETAASVLPVEVIEEEIDKTTAKVKKAKIKTEEDVKSEVEE